MPACSCCLGKPSTGHMSYYRRCSGSHWFSSPRTSCRTQIGCRHKQGGRCLVGTAAPPNKTFHTRRSSTRRTGDFCMHPPDMGSPPRHTRTHTGPRCTFVRPHRFCRKHRNVPGRSSYLHKHRRTLRAPGPSSCNFRRYNRYLEGTDCRSDHNVDLKPER